VLKINAFWLILTLRYDNSLIACGLIIRYKKPVSTIFAILILFQTLVFSSLAKINLPFVCTDTWEESGIQKQVVLDPFLMPGKEGFQQNVQDKNEWIPFHDNKTFTIRNTSSLPLVSSKPCLITGL